MPPRTPRPARRPWWAPLLVGVVGCATDHGPVIASVAPEAAPRGTTVRLDGLRFCGDDAEVVAGACVTLPAARVDFGLNDPVRAIVMAWADATIEVVVPDVAPVGATEIIVTVAGTSSNAVDFVVEE